MNRRFIINLIFAVGINLLIKPFWILGVERGVQNAIGASAYGFYFSLFSFSFLFNVILDFGINNYNSAFIARYPHLISKKFTQLLMLKLMLVLVYIVFTFAVAFIAGYDQLQFKLLFVLCLNQILSFFITYLRSNISGLQYYITDSLLSVVDRLLMIVFCSLLLWGHVLGEMKLIWFVYAQTLSYSITALLCFMVVRPHLGSLNWNWNKAFMVHLLKRSYPYALLGILMGIYTKIDGVLIERLLEDGKTQAGNYASAYRLLDAYNMIAVLFASLLLPMFSRILQTKQKPDNLLQLGFITIILPAIAGASVCFFYADQLILLLNKTSNPEISSVLKLLMISFVFNCLVYVYGTFLTAYGNLKLLNRIALLACVMSILLNWFLIPQFGIIGAAITSMIIQAFVGLAHFIYSHHKYQVNTDFKVLFKIALFIILQPIIAYVLIKFECHLYVKLLLTLSFSGIAILLLRIINISQLKKVITRT